jgi:hypothetical protein
MAMRTQPVLIAAIVAVATALAFVAGRGTAGETTVIQVPAAVRPARPLVVQAGTARLDPPTQEAIRDMLRAEISAALDEREAQADDAKRAAADVPPTAEQIAAADTGRAIITAAIQAGHWTRADADALRAQLANATRSQGEELLSTLFPALNRGELTPDFAGPPM